MIPPYQKFDPGSPKFRRNADSVKIVDVYKIAVENPLTENLSFNDIELIIDTYQEVTREKIAWTRDGVVLPSSLGFVFVGAIYKGTAVDHKTSKTYNQRLHFQNWESDNYLCKIYYTNYETKYHFRYRQYWMFDSDVYLRRMVSKAFIDDYTKYVQPKNTKVISNMFKNKQYQQKRIENMEEDFSNYNEFDLL